MNLIYRYPYNGSKEWLIFTEKSHIEIKEGKKFFSHGNLVNQEEGGNGYHGNCENCGLALVTDLGYNSWDDTLCELKEKTTITVTQKKRWTKIEGKATILSENKTRELFSDLIYEQGWGTYNFQIKNLEE